MSAAKSWHSFGKEVFEQCRELVECPLPSPPVWKSPLLRVMLSPSRAPKGTLVQTLHPEMILEQEGNIIHVKRPSDDKAHCALHGMTRALLHNMVVGVSEGFKKELEINGVGYRAEKKGNELVMNLGYSHQVIVPRSMALPSRSPHRTRLSSTAPISRRSVSSLPKSARSVLPSLIRARASSMSMKSSAARSVRPALRSKEVCRYD